MEAVGHEGEGMEKPSAEDLHSHEGGDDPEGGQELAIGGVVDMGKDRTVVFVPMRMGARPVIVRVGMWMMMIGPRSHESLFAF